MKKYIKLAILVILCMIIVIIGLILINKNNNNNETIETIRNNGEKIDFNKFTIVQDLNEYFIIKNIIDRYFANIKELNGDSYINENNLRTSKEEAIEQKKNEAKKYLNNILDEEYKKNYNISDEILNNEAKKYIQNGNYSNSEIVYNVILKELYKLSYTDDISLFLISAKLRDNNIKMLIKFDTTNNTYTIFLSNYIEDNNISINMETDNLKISKEGIKENIYNRIISGKITDEEISKEYFNIQKNNLLYDLKEEYDNLNEEYKNKKYNEYSDFENYYLNKKNELTNSQLNKYRVETINNKKIYTLIDNYNNIYIIETSEVFIDFDVKLDNYTVDLPEFTEKYNKANDQEKVVLNMGKIITAINNQDYRYVYSKLADSFKNNYFDSEDSLKEFLQKNIYPKNEIKFDDFEREGNIYTYKVRIIKQYEEGEEIQEGKNAPYRKFNIVMQLKEDSDFVMSFSIDE